MLCIGDNTDDRPAKQAWLTLPAPAGHGMERGRQLLRAWHASCRSCRRLEACSGWPERHEGPEWPEAPKEMKRVTGTAGLADCQGKMTPTLLMHPPRLRHAGRL